MKHWQFDLWPTYRVIALPIVEIEEKERVAKPRAEERKKKKSIVGDESINARERSLLTSRSFRDYYLIIILPTFLCGKNRNFNIYIFLTFPSRLNAVT